jgi:hypothetical protein
MMLLSASRRTAVHPDGTVTIYQQGGVAVPSQPEQNLSLSKWLDVEA